MRQLSDPFPEKPLPFRVEAAAASDVGRQRSNNEDRVVVVDLATGVAVAGGAESTAHARGGDWFAAVCDGMGGEEGGEVASAMAVDALLAAMIESRARGDLADAVRAALEHASRRVFAEARRVPRLARMGTTATVAALGDSEVVVGHVGDSRAYLFRRGALVQLTRDQTLAALLAERTCRPPAEIAEAVGANVILQAVGARPSVEVALTRVPIAPGDVLLLCSDGLSGPVDDDVLRDLLAANPEPGRACAALVSAANERGGPDNVSCIVARFLRP
jgi:serine/threonine protein phosphatase PrpC